MPLKAPAFATEETETISVDNGAQDDLVLRPSASYRHIEVFSAIMHNDYVNKNYDVYGCSIVVNIPFHSLT